MFNSNPNHVLTVARSLFSLASPPIFLLHPIHSFVRSNLYTMGLAGCYGYFAIANLK